MPFRNEWAGPEAASRAWTEFAVTEVPTAPIRAFHRLTGFSFGMDYWENWVNLEVLSGFRHSYYDLQDPWPRSTGFCKGVGASPD